MADSPDLLSLPFDQFQRYSAVAEVADSLRAHLSKLQLRVLDVGGFHSTRDGQAMLPLVQFLPSDLAVATDLAESVLPNYVRASGAALPFAPEAFELVVTAIRWSTYCLPAAQHSSTSCCAWPVTACS